MTLDDKRGVIELLLCVGMEGGDDITNVATALDAKGLVMEAHCCWAEVSDPSPFVAKPLRQYELDATEAAYRLIESSPTLRREWFGAR